MKNIHILPTDKPSRLLKIEDRLNFDSTSLLTEFYKNFHKYKNQNIYITNSEEIKKGDWCMSLCDDESYEEIYQCKNIGLVDDEDKKIILTTDQDLDGIQAIDDEFLEWFVKNPSCEEVKVLKYKSNNMHKMNLGYKIILPKEEPKKEQDKDKYSEEEVIKLLHKRDEHMNTYDKLHGGFQTPKEWFEQFKNK